MKHVKPIAELDTPELVCACPYCKGEGEYVQSYLEGRFTGPCQICKGARFVYRSSGVPVPKSVRAQIETMNGVTFDRIFLGQDQ